VVLVPGHHCFGISAPLPPGTLESEHAGVALLAIEQASPFPVEHLATGHIVPAPGDGIVATAVYRRKLTPADIEPWKEAQAVLPDYAAFLCARSIPTGAVVILETAACVTALDFGNGAAPQRIVSRAITSEGGSDPGAQAREQVLAKLNSAGRAVHRYKLGDVPVQQRGTRLRFNWVPVAGAPAVECEMAERVAWAQDLRDSEESHARRKSAGRERAVVRVCSALVLLLVILLIGEGLLILGSIWIGGREGALAGTAPAVQQIESDFEVSNRLDAYGPSKPMPLELLAYINDLRPRSIYFTRTSFDSPAQMTIEAATGNLNDVTVFEEALKRAPGLALVETRKTASREGGATFQLILAFRPGFNPDTEPAPAAASSPPEIGIPIEP
jgi:hypothetical protein